MHTDQTNYCGLHGIKSLVFHPESAILKGETGKTYVHTKEASILGQFSNSEIEMSK